MSKELIKQESEIKDVAMLLVGDDEEQLTQEELNIPFIKIAQSLSPQLKKSSPDFIEGLEEGEFFNTATRENYGKKLKMQVLTYYRNFTIWKGEEKGEGEFSGTMTPEEFAEYSRDKSLDRDGGDLKENRADGVYRYTDTRNFICRLPDYLETGIVILALSSTGIKPAKTWNTAHKARKLNGQQTMRCATIWELETGDFTKGSRSWKQISKIHPLGYAGEEVFKQGLALVDFAKEIKANADKMRYGQDEENTPEESEF